MKDFFKFTLATVTGIILSSIVLFFIGIMVIFGIVSSSDTETVVKKNSVMMLDLNGTLVERTQESLEGIFSALTGDDSNVYGLDDILSSIKKAKENDKIKGIYIQPSYLATSFASLEEIRNALQDFKESGKFIVAYADQYTQGMYYLASVADKVIINPQGNISWHGLASQPVFFKDLLDKLGVDVQVFKVGTYKSAVEPFIATEMSPANREQVTVFLNSIWNQLLDDVSETDLKPNSTSEIDKDWDDLSYPSERVLNEELDGEDDGSEIEEFCDAVKELEAAAEIKEKIRKEIKRYKILSQGSAEANVERGYIETLLEMPWDKMSEDNRDLDAAAQVLDEDHYGMKKIKERILESLAVRNITSKGDAPILCLVGPPGTGKTSIARSVAKALNKKYVRICLGGVRDEAEIRGHRKTYVGAMPGRIITAFKAAGVKNPLMLLDEIDKISSDYKGDTASALLEVLDSEQNSHFVDHYIELPTDLSQVLFIATANDLSTVSRPLLDRMEIIEVSSYTKNEKLHIAKEHLVPKQLEKNGLMAKQLKFSDKALESMIDGYTREAGVRSLEREIAKVCRKAVRQLYHGNGELNEEVKSIRITDKNLKDFLGKVKFKPENIHKKNEVGIVRGLAWTSVGGDTLEIEVNTMPGKGELILTGQMGDVMQESARIALTYVRSITSGRKYKVEQEYFDTHSIHLHIPEGAVPKDGPSAGVTMTTAMLSAVTGIPVHADVAMTGEVTLRGRVLPIGGLKEKLLAAKTAGMKKVLVPSENRSDVEEFDEEITGGMEIVFVSEMKQVLEHALVPGNQDK